MKVLPEYEQNIAVDETKDQRSLRPLYKVKEK
jgi:hypothetical protein